MFQRKLDRINLPNWFEFYFENSKHTPGFDRIWTRMEVLLLASPRDFCYVG